MKKMLLANIKTILVGIVALLGVLAGSLGGGYIASVPAPATLGAIPGTDLPNPYCQGGLCKAVVAGTCADATTTLAVINNPFVNATSTAKKAYVEITGVATSSAALTLATSTLIRYAPVSLATRSATTTSLINTAPIYWSGFGRGTTTIVSGVSNVDGAWNTATTGSTTLSPAGGILLAPGAATSSLASQLVLWATDNGGVGSTAGITDLTNLFACKYTVEFEAVAR